jgi:hypothetical protein
VEFVSFTPPHTPPNEFPKLKLLAGQRLKAFAPGRAPAPLSLDKAGVLCHASLNHAPTAGRRARTPCPWVAGPKVGANGESTGAVGGGVPVAVRGSSVQVLRWGWAWKAKASGTQLYPTNEFSALVRRACDPATGVRSLRYNGGITRYDKGKDPAPVPNFGPLRRVLFVGEKPENASGWVGSGWAQFRLAGLFPPSYTYSFRVAGRAGVAQRQSSGFVNRRL